MCKKSLRLGLVGKDVSASCSGEIHSFILKRLGVDVEYEKISVSMDDFDDAMRYLLGDFDGFNVTIPYKRDVMEYVDELAGDAMDYGAVNTVFRSVDFGNIVGVNTDGLGFMQALRIHGVDVFGKKVLILGAGGAGRACAVALKKAGATVAMYQRRKEELEEACEQLGVIPAENPERGGYDIIVNATGVGMHESVGQSPVTENAFSGASVAVDLIYRPSPSEFLRIAETRGLRTLSGGAMLFLQAYYADCYFLGRTPCEQEAEDLYRHWLEYNV